MADNIENGLPPIPEQGTGEQDLFSGREKSPGRFVFEKGDCPLYEERGLASFLLELYERTDYNANDRIMTGG